MDCQIEFSVMSECLAGYVADAWEYEVEAKVFSEGLMASGIIAVGGHKLRPGSPASLADLTRKVLLPARPSGSTAQVELAVNAKDVRWLADETHRPVVTIPVSCPELGAPPYTIETDIPLAIDQAPGFNGGEARFTVRARLVATCLASVPRAGDRT